MLGPTHHLLCYGAEPSAGLDPRLCTVIPLGPAETEADERYEVAASGYSVLVRPDGYIAWRGVAREALVESLKRFT